MHTRNESFRGIGRDRGRKRCIADSRRRWSRKKGGGTETGREGRSKEKVEKYERKKGEKEGEKREKEVQKETEKGRERKSKRRKERRRWATEADKC